MAFQTVKIEGEIIIRIFTKKNHTAILYVKDNGKGIPERENEVLGKQIVNSKKGKGTAIFNII